MWRRMHDHETMYVFCRIGDDEISYFDVKFNANISGNSIGIVDADAHEPNIAQR